MNERFVERMNDKKVRHDIVVLADFIQIWCDEHHADQERHQINTDAEEIGAYGRKHLVLCDECEAHLAYAEKRRAYCPKDPKPFCAHCDTHCYKPDEREWHRLMMRFSGPKSWRKGHTLDGIKHALQGRKWKREMERRGIDPNTDRTSASAAR